MTKFTAALATLIPLALASIVLAGTATEPQRGVSRDSPPEIAAPEPVAVGLTPAVAVVGADAEERTRLDEALARFSDNGLELPDLEVQFSSDEADCSGHLGLFKQSFTPWRLSICSGLAFVPTHELAHAWEAANLDDDARGGYVVTRGLASWDDPAVDRGDRGIEDLAFMIQQNLMATNPSLASSTWIERVDAYELVTGRPSPLHRHRAHSADRRGE